MLTAPNDPFILNMPRDNAKDELFHHLSRDGGEADQSVVTWILLVLFEDQSDICFPPVLRHLSYFPQLTKDDGGVA